MKRILGHLAQFATLSKQGEVLCTQGLAYLLQDRKAQQAFSNFIGAACDTRVPEVSNWRTEFRQPDRGRPDLEGCRPDGTAAVKIEAKLGAPFGERQLASYLSELSTRAAPGILLVLVPEARHEEALHYVASELKLSGQGPWRLQETPELVVAAIAWEKVFSALEGLSAGITDDLLQLQSMYRVLNGDDMEPITSDEEVLLWRERRDWWRKLADVLARELHPPGHHLFPFGEEKKIPYYRRYTWAEGGFPKSCYSVGTRDPFEGYITPLWLRFHKRTAHFDTIYQNLRHSDVASRLVESGGHVWIPLEVPSNANRDVMIGKLKDQVNEILSAAYQWAERAATV